MMGLEPTTPCMQSSGQACGEVQIIPHALCLLGVRTIGTITSSHGLPKQLPPPNGEREPLVPSAMAGEQHGSFADAALSESVFHREGQQDLPGLRFMRATFQRYR